MGKLGMLKSAWLAALLMTTAAAVGAQGAAGSLRSGYRAVSLPVPPHQMAYIAVGDRVDVLVTFEALLPKGTKEMVTATILQNVVVLKTEPSAGAVLLELNPNEAQYAALSVGPNKSLWLVARAPGDMSMKPMEMASFRKLFR